MVGNARQPGSPASGTETLSFYDPNFGQQNSDLKKECEILQEEDDSDLATCVFLRKVPGGCRQI